MENHTNHIANSSTVYCYYNWYKRQNSPRTCIRYSGTRSWTNL